ncbi:MAG: SpoIID/LytB domain-containing protein [Solirubrobacterales bacterium]|nr:SpoIID/LytB domain-containing protein [Solirubrobacterales bacterium]
MRARHLLPLIPVALALALPSGATAKTTWIVNGAGFGHGVGMSAYGAYGYGKHDVGYRKILSHYFRHVKVRRKRSSPTVKVLLDVRAGDVAFSRATRACGKRLRPTRTYRAHRSGGAITLTTRSGRRIEGCGKRLQATGRSNIKVAGLGRYRGAINAVAASSGSINVVNQVGVNAYAQGVLPGEIYPSWPKQTLRAFAVAARSIALATDVGGEGYGLYADTRTQVYEGAGEETRRTNAAVQATRDEVLTHRGRVIQAFYHSSSGGRTESRFLGAPKVPWLKSVRDPYDKLAPLHRWRVRFSQAEVNTMLGGYVDGRVRRIVVLKRGDSPRIVRAKIVSDRGSARIRGDALAAALGLYDRWAFFRKRR